MLPEKHHKLVLGITGGIAAYKSAELIRLLQKRGCDVKVIMTENACHFLGPDTCMALTGHPVVIGMFEESNRIDLIEHISLADWADAVIVAPATANIIGKITHGIADDFLSTFLLAFKGPLLIAPAMNPGMYSNPAVQRNLETLTRQGIRFAGPDSGESACGHIGIGRMTSVDIIADLAGAMMGQNGDYAGRRVLITAGPTRESVDPVRFISNRSSGKMGFAIAAAAAERGAEVHLVSGPVNLEPHAAVILRKVVTADEMRSAVMEEISESDLFIMAAAVADWKPLHPRAQKWKKGSSTSETLSLVQTSDILTDAIGVQGKPRVTVGFAAETENFSAEGTRKLREKKLDAIVVNDVSGTETGFETDLNQGFILDREENRIEIPRCQKREMAEKILDFCVTLMQKRH